MSALQIWKTISILVCSIGLICSQSASAFDLVGVIDRTGKTIVPCEYSVVDYLGRGFFFLGEINPSNPGGLTIKGSLVNHEGKEVPIKIPDGCTLSKVFLPEAVKDEPAGDLPAQTIFEINSKSGFGLCKVSGEIVLEPKFQAIGIPSEGFFPVLTGIVGSRTYLKFTLDSKTGDRKPPPSSKPITLQDTEASRLRPFEVLDDGRGVWGYMNPNGTIHIEPHFARAYNFSKSGLARITLKRVGKSAYIDESGKIQSPIYKSAEDNFEKNAIVTVDKFGLLKMGLIDRNFNFVIQPDYMELSRLSADVFVAKTHKEGIYKALSSDGKTLLKFPPEIVKVWHLFDNQFLCDSKVALQTKKVIVDSQGKILGPQDAGHPLQLEHGLGVIYKQFKGTPRYFGLADREGNVVIPLQEAKFKVVSTDRILKYCPNKHFYPAAWNPISRFETSGANFRVPHFACFLNDFDLIGMSKIQLESLLGASECKSRNQRDSNSFYTIGQAMCGNSWTGIEIEFADHIVSRWRQVWYANYKVQTAPWISSNMIVDSSEDRRDIRTSDEPPLRLIPKVKPAASAN